MRTSLGIEGVLLAVIGGIVGLGLGIVYGWLGIRTLIGAEDIPTVLSVPWASLVGVLVVTVIAGLLASILPARRAVRLSPAAVLAVE